MTHARICRRPLVVLPILTALVLGVSAGPSVAGTWTINGEIQNNTGSDGACSDGAPSGYLGCITAGVGYLDDGSLRNGNSFGAPPATFTPQSGGTNPSSFEFFAPYFGRGADQYTSMTMPDGSVYVITAEDDESSGGVSGNYAGCAEADDQGSPIMCTPEWSGSYENPQLTFTFGPSQDSQVPSVGQRCSADLGGDASQGASVDCRTDGGIGQVDSTNFVQLFSRGPTPVQATVQSAYGPQGCTMAGYGDTCWLGTSSNSDITLTAVDPSNEAWFGVEVVAVANGPTPGTAPNSVPNAGDVRANVTSLRVKAPVAAARASTVATAGRHATKPDARPRITYRTDRRASTVFRLARATRAGHARKRWVRVGHDAVQSSRTIVGRRRAGRCVTRGRTAVGKRCKETFRVRGLFAHRGRGKRRRTVRLPKALAPGRYRLTARARAWGAGVTGPARSVTFTVPGAR